MSDRLFEDLLQDYKNIWQPVFTGEIYEFADKYLRLPAISCDGNVFDVSTRKYLIEPYKALRNDKIKKVCVQAAIRSGKSILQQTFLVYRLMYSNGTMLALYQDKLMADKIMKDRIEPLIMSCDELRNILPTDRFTVTKTGIRFPPNSTLYVDSQRVNALQNLSINTLLVDECWLFDATTLKQAEGRTLTAKNKKILMVSQAGPRGCEWDKEFRQHTLMRYAWKCPHCEFIQPWDWARKREDDTYSGITWDKIKDKDGNYILSKVIPTVRLECYKCRQFVTNTIENRRKLDQGIYLKMNDGNYPDTISYHWSALADYNTYNWSDLVIEYLTADKDADQNYTTKPLDLFYEQKLADQFDSTRKTLVVPSIKCEFDESDWADEAGRFMGIDPNQTHDFGVTIMAFGKDRQTTRTLFSDYVKTWAEIESLQKKYKVSHSNVIVDCNYDQSTIVNKCTETGFYGINNKTKKKEWICWSVSRGEPCECYYTIDNKGNKQPVGYKLDAKLRGQNKQSCYYIQWSNSFIKNITNSLYRNGKWSVSNVHEDYDQQMNEEQYINVFDPKKGRNIKRWKPKNEKNRVECWDTSNLCVLLAYYRGLVGSPLLT